MSELDPVLEKIAKFYKLPKGQYFKFLNAKGHSLHGDRRLTPLTWDVKRDGIRHVFQDLHSCS